MRSSQILNEAQRPMAATTALHLPPELWCIILNDFNLYQPDTLFSVSLACRYLHNIAQAFIFRIFCLSHMPVVRGGNPSRAIARLAFYASDAIAPHVLEINIYVCLRGVDSAQIATPFFNALSRFSNTRSLSFLGVHFTQLGLQQISSLSLEMLHVTECTLPLHIDPLPMLRTHTFGYRNEAYRIDPLSTRRWLALLNPDYLQEFDGFLSPDTCAFFLASDNLSRHPFPSLHTMDCTCDQVTLPQFPQLLSRTPALRYLKMCLRADNPEEYIRIIESFGSLPCSVPYLEEYSGYHELLTLVLGRAVKSPSAHLRRLVLKSMAEWGDPLDAFLSTLKSCHPFQLRHLTHLHFARLKSADLNSLTILQDMVPALQELHIHSSKHDCSAYKYDVQLTDLYTLSLPTGIVSLSIQWTSPRNNTDVPSLVAAKDNLVPRLPSLRRLWLCDLRKMALLWNRTASGKEERCTLHKVGRKDRISAAWKMRVAVFPEEPRYV